ncbi:hypothetical protein CM15mP35_04830 [bacterium]|nr:MAG: hypothetical protein CM15mP35_04830 [bacterium]
MLNFIVFYIFYVVFKNKVVFDCIKVGLKFNFSVKRKKLFTPKVFIFDSLSKSILFKEGPLPIMTHASPEQRFLYFSNLFRSSFLKYKFLNRCHIYYFFY